MVVGNIFDNPEMLKCETPLENYIDRICLMCSKKCNEYLESGVDLYKHNVRNLRADLEKLNEIKKGLRKENRELKKLLKLAIEDIDNCSFCSMCANHNDENKCRKCKAITLDMFKWKHGDEVEKLLKGNTVEAVADVQTVKHGKWRFSGNYSPTKNWICSECNGLVTMPVYCWKSYYNYCPNCGAKMDDD